MKKGEIRMRITIDIQDDILKEVMEETDCTNTKKAVETALKEYVRMKRRQELIRLIGNYKEFSLSLGDMNDMRRR